MERKQPKTCVWVSAVGRERNFAKVSDYFGTDEDIDFPDPPNMG